MTDHEEYRRREQQQRALDVYRRPSGAMIMHQHLTRRQKVVGVTKDDLEDILGFDGVAAGMAGFGTFLVSGAGWVLVAKMMDSEGIPWGTGTGICFASVIFGFVALGVGLHFHQKKRGRIKRIFDQTVMSDTDYRAN